MPKTKSQNSGDLPSTIGGFLSRYIFCADGNLVCDLHQPAARGVMKSCMQTLIVADLHPDTKVEGHTAGRLMELLLQRDEGATIRVCMHDFRRDATNPRTGVARLTQGGRLYIADHATRIAHYLHPDHDNLFQEERLKWMSERMMKAATKAETRLARLMEK